MKRFWGILFALVLVFSLAANPTSIAFAASTIYVGSEAPNAKVYAIAETPTIVWVDDDYAPGEYNDGHTWGYDAFAKIQDGIDAVAGSIVHVAAGYYVENIILADGVQVLGAGAEVATIDGNGVYHVVVGANNTTLDGFTITGGNANGTGNNGKGGGMFNDNSSPMVSNCTFYNNSAWDDGGGMFNQESSPTVTNCTFSTNSAGWGGWNVQRGILLANGH